MSKKKDLQEILDEMSTTGGTATFTPGTGEQTAEPVRVKKKLKAEDILTYSDLFNKIYRSRLKIGCFLMVLR